ncbi:10853_t:CDS:2, partial [Diversispora eburnea]
ILKQVEVGQFIQDLKMNVLQEFILLFQTLHLLNIMSIKEFLSILKENIIYEDLKDNKIIIELVDIFKKSKKNIKDVEELDDSIEPVIIEISITLK